MVNAGQYPVDADADGSVRMLAAKESHVVPSFCRNTDGKRMRERMRVSFVLDMSDGVAPQSSTDAHCNSHGKYCILPLSWIYDIPIIVHQSIHKTNNPTNNASYYVLTKYASNNDTHYHRRCSRCSIPPSISIRSVPKIWYPRPFVSIWIFFP